MRYLTYEGYVEIGGKLENTAFSRYIDRVCGLIDKETKGRVKEMAEIPDAVKALCRDLVEYFDGNGGGTRQLSSVSQSAGGVSQSESYIERYDESIQDMFGDYLYGLCDDHGTPLLYKGALV